MSKAMTTGRTYKTDLPLFEKLGLRPFDDAPHATWLHVGDVQLDNGISIRLEVQCWPAQFWKATIGETIVTTASGNFTQFWPLFEMIARGRQDAPLVQAAIKNEDISIE